MGGWVDAGGWVDGWMLVDGQSGWMGGWVNMHLYGWICTKGWIWVEVLEVGKSAWVDMHLQGLSPILVWYLRLDLMVLVRMSPVNGSPWKSMPSGPDQTSRKVSV